MQLIEVNHTHTSVHAHFVNCIASNLEICELELHLELGVDGWIN